MISDPFSGDPLVIIGPSGSTMQFTAGQPLMDGGVQNEATLRLFTGPGWVGNLLLPAANQMGSTFEQNAVGIALTLSGLHFIQDLAVKTLTASPVFSTVSATATNPTSDRVKMTAVVGPGTQPLDFQRNGPNWQNQATNPAGSKVTVVT